MQELGAAGTVTLLERSLNRVILLSGPFHNCVWGSRDRNTAERLLCLPHEPSRQLRCAALSAIRVALRSRCHPYLRDRIVFLTGDVLGPEAHDFFAQVDKPRLEKPWKAQEVRHVIQQVLESR